MGKAADLSAIALAFGAIPFEMTCYYEKDMGSPLERRWLCFGLADPSGLSRWRRECMEIEDSFSDGGRRRVNLDLGKLVLASCKAAPDKIYLQQRRVCPHLSLIRKRGLRRPRSQLRRLHRRQVQRFLHGARALYRKALR